MNKDIDLLSCNDWWSKKKEELTKNIELTLETAQQKESAETLSIMLELLDLVKIKPSMSDYLDKFTE